LMSRIGNTAYMVLAWWIATIATAEHSPEIVVRSESFLNGDSIPIRFTGDGEDLSPHLSWRGIPSGAKSMVLSVDDPDAARGTWNHWYVYNVPPSVNELPAGASSKHLLPVGSIEALNDFKRQTYGGPCPPSGRHRYIFRVRALDRTIHHPSLDRVQVERELRGHVIADGKLLGDRYPLF